MNALHRQYRHDSEEPSNQVWLSTVELEMYAGESSDLNHFLNACAFSRFLHEIAAGQFEGSFKSRPIAVVNQGDKKIRSRVVTSRLLKDVLRGEETRQCRLILTSDDLWRCPLGLRAFQPSCRDPEHLTPGLSLWYDTCSQLCPSEKKVGVENHTFQYNLGSLR